MRLEFGGDGCVQGQAALLYPLVAAHANSIVAWAVGTLVGVNLLPSGFSMISIGSAARSLARRVQ